MCICQPHASSVHQINLLLPPDCKASINRRVEAQMENEVHAPVSNSKRFPVFGTCTHSHLHAIIGFVLGRCTITKSTLKQE